MEAQRQQWIADQRALRERTRSAAKHANADQRALARALEQLKTLKTQRAAAEKAWDESQSMVERERVKVASRAAREAEKVRQRELGDYGGRAAPCCASPQAAGFSLQLGTRAPEKRLLVGRVPLRTWCTS